MININNNDIIFKGSNIVVSAKPSILGEDNFSKAHVIKEPDTITI